MDSKTLTRLEYDRITALLADHATSEPGRQRCLGLIPSADIGEIRLSQERTAAALSRIVAGGGFSFDGCRDVETAARRLEVGGVLESAELLRICELCETAGRAKAYGKAGDCLDTYFERLFPLSMLSNEIRRCIGDDNRLNDEADAALRRIRRSIVIVTDRIHSTLTDLVNGSLRVYLQDAIVTERGERYCIPVKAEYRHQVNGIVHDRSSTGSTLFIEPAAVVNLNNELRELFAREQEEIRIILGKLSAMAAEYTDEILADYDTLGILDFIFAKGSLALAMDAVKPVFNDRGFIEIRGARHPLLDRDTVVPITVTLGGDFDLLVVTGPNTGGKTVSLKTVGLLTLMGQAGLHIPALEGSKLAVFENVCADIGDEQSIEQNLSTFSSHMTNIVSFLRRVDSRCLVLFDELGAGTDPAEGAALAVAILSYLHERGIRTMATTHYSELKVYALSTEGVENASCEFDVETLRPTYRLLIGAPGKSNAFAISGKLGLPDYIIEDAKRRLSSRDESLENLIADLEDSRRAAERERNEARELKAEAERLKKDTDRRRNELENRRDRIIGDAREKANAILREAKNVADESIKRIRKLGQDAGSAARLEQERANIRDALSENDVSPIKPSVPSGRHKLSDFHLGDTVKIHSLNMTGTVSSLPDGNGNLYVRMGAFRSRVNISDLTVIEEAAAKRADGSAVAVTGDVRMNKSAAVSPQINLIGKTVDEAVAELDKYLDDAYLAHLDQVRVIHGKGTGALREGIRGYLKKAKYVKSFRQGAFGEGDAGVTVVEFK